MKTFLFGFLVLVTAVNATAQKTDKKLQKEVEALLQGFNGSVGVFVKNLKNGKTVAVNADTLFPTASMVKVPILLGITDRLNRGELSYHQSFVYKDSLLYLVSTSWARSKTTKRLN